MKSKLAERSVKNSGLKTIFKSGYFFWKDEHVPGTTVDLIKKIVSFFSKLKKYHSMLGQEF